MKSELLKIVQKINDEAVLRTLYDFLKQVGDLDKGAIWKSLTEEQKKEVYSSFDESEDDNNIIPWDDIKKKY